MICKHAPKSVLGFFTSLMISIDMLFCTGVHGPQSTIAIGFSDPRTFPVAPAGQTIE